jgi:hypothetical protein
VKIYISGPIAGRPDKNQEAFRLEAYWIRKVSNALPITVPRSYLTSVNPHDLAPYAHGGGRDACPEGYLTKEESPEHSTACYIRADLISLLFCDAVLLIEGWQDSRGSKMERNVANWAGIPVYTTRRFLLKELFGDNYDKDLESV